MPVAERRKRAVRGRELGALRIVGIADDADGAEELAVRDDGTVHLDAIERNTAGSHAGRIVVIGEPFAGNDARPATRSVAGRTDRSGGNGTRARDALVGIEGDVEIAAAIRVLDAIERGAGRVRDAGREMNAADEAHRARGERRLVVAEERGRARDADGQFVIRAGHTGLAEDRQRTSGAVDDRHGQRAVDRIGSAAHDGLDLRRRQRIGRRAAIGARNLRERRRRATRRLGGGFHTLAGSADALGVEREREDDEKRDRDLECGGRSRRFGRVAVLLRGIRKRWLRPPHSKTMPRFAHI